MWFLRAATDEALDARLADAQAREVGSRVDAARARRAATELTVATAVVRAYYRLVAAPALHESARASVETAEATRAP